MKIIIPFDPDTFFSMEEHSLLKMLRLEDAQVLDQALQNWTTYVFGRADEIYERTVDQAHELIELTHRGSDEGIRLQMILSENADQLTALMKSVAMRLHQLLQSIPDEITRRTFDTGEYHFLYVESIHEGGKFAVITSDIADLQRA